MIKKFLVIFCLLFISNSAFAYSIYKDVNENTQYYPILYKLNKDGIILADNILYKGYVMSDYNKHKQRTAVRNLREYIKEVTENPNLETEIIEIGDGLAVTKQVN